MSPQTDYDCTRAAELLDLRLDRELTDFETEAIERHLQSCAPCAAAMARIAGLRKRIRAASQTILIPTTLEPLIKQSLEARPRRAAWFQWPVAAAAAAALAVSGGFSYSRGYLRLTEDSRDSYIAAVGPQVAGVMRIGLADHIHCAVFHPGKEPAGLAEMARNLGPGYRDLIPIMVRRVPHGYRLVAGHRCEYHGRWYIHLVAIGEEGPISLLLTKRGQGEAFESDLRSVAARTGTPLYSSGVQRFNIAGFETRDHLIYLVSDLNRDRNLDTLADMTTELREAVGKLEL